MVEPTCRSLINGNFYPLIQQGFWSCWILCPWPIAVVVPFPWLDQRFHRALRSWTYIIFFSASSTCLTSLKHFFHRHSTITTLYSTSASEMVLRINRTYSRSSDPFLSLILMKSQIANSFPSTRCATSTFVWSMLTRHPTSPFQELLRIIYLVTRPSH